MNTPQCLVECFVFDIVFTCERYDLLVLHALPRWACGAFVSGVVYCMKDVLSSTKCIWTWRRSQCTAYSSLDMTRGAKV